MENNDAKVFSWVSKVRDYECDIGFFVHNANYLKYMEQARHDYLRALKFDFAKYAKKKVGFVLVNMTVDFRRSLTIDDEFIVETILERPSKRRVLFTQNIYRLPDRTLMVTAKNTVVPINAEGQAEMPDEIEKLLVDFPIPSPN